MSFGTQELTRPCSAIYNGDHTLTNNRTTEHWTFSIRTQKETSRFHPGERLISVLAGPDNNASWRAIGVVEEGGINLFRRGSMMLITNILFDMLTGRCEFVDWELLSATTCIVCNRKLTTPTSIRRGIGPICEDRAPDLDGLSSDLKKKLVKFRRLMVQLESSTVEE